MRRIIEELIEKRKKQQWKVKEILVQLGQLIEKNPLFFKKANKQKISSTLLEFNQELNQLITLQDREWDAYSNNHSSEVFKSLQWKIGKLEAEYANVKTLLINFVTLEKSLDNLIKSISDKTPEETLNRLEDIKGELSTYQYSDFEQRFRGEENQIKDKLKKYLPNFANSAPVLDIGCGRGEFLELLHKEGIEAMGVDISKSMLKSAQNKGLKCQQSDAMQFLRQTKDHAFGGIFSSQVAEHLPAQYLRDLVMEAQRVLKPGSPLLMETINPLSIFALSNIYFLDATHQNPLHPEYMRYLFESSGFGDVEIIYSEELRDELLEEIEPGHQIARVFNKNVDKLNKLLFSSPVYAAKGTKP